MSKYSKEYYNKKKPKDFWDKSLQIWGFVFFPKRKKFLLKIILLQEQKKTLVSIENKSIWYLIRITVVQGFVFKAKHIFSQDLLYLKCFYI